MIKNEAPQAWRYYEIGRAYNQSLTPNQYTLVDTNIEFFAGNQWLHLTETPAMAKLPKPVFNILKRIVTLFVASLTSSAVTVSIEPLTYFDGDNIRDEESDASAYATAEIKNLLEKFKIDYRVREALIDGAQTGDYAAHFFFDPDKIPYGGAFGAYRGEIEMELVDGINVMFGNPTEDDIQKQPYVLLVGRDTVGNLRREMKRARKRWRSKVRDTEDDIVPDTDNQFFAGQGGKTEPAQTDEESDRATYVYMYTKVQHEEPLLDPDTGEQVMEADTDANGDPVFQKDDKGNPILGVDGMPIVKQHPAKKVVTSVYVTKATKTATIYENVDTGLSLYPIAWGNWEKQKNQYHGRALITGLVPNQIYLNKMFALIMQHTQLASLPKYLYNADIIPVWTNEVGQAIGVHNLQPGQSIDGVATSIKPADMSGAIIATLDKTLAYTKECLGATDAQMGNVKPDNTSALMVLQNSAEVPLENIRAGLYEWIEDMSAILLDMMGTYYGTRPMLRDRDFQEMVTGPDGSPIIDPMTGQMQMETKTRRVLEPFNFATLKDLWFNVRVDVGATTYYSELAAVQTLDNLHRDGTLDTIAYVERVPDKFLPRKAELLERLKQMQSTEAAQVSASAPSPDSGMADALMGNLDKETAFGKLPQSTQNRLSELPKKAQNALYKTVGGG